jgi:Cd2+/Zn2+-exporting ATPase/Cu+-exporting ATPase
MDCAECTEHVQKAISSLPGVQAADVLLASEKAIVRLDPALVDLQAIRQAVHSAGYSIPENAPAPETTLAMRDLTRRVMTLFGIVFGAVLFIVVIGEWFGLFEALTERVPFAVGLGLVLLTGFPVFINVIRAALKKQVTSHTLMSLGVLAALAVGQWATAAVVVFFMRVGDYAESFTTERARDALRDLTALAPQAARVERDGKESNVPIAEVKIGDVVIVRPGEKIPVDGQVISGHATIDQSTITGESMPVEVSTDTNIFAATIAQFGTLRVRATRIGMDTTFGRVIKLVEEAEIHRRIQRFADRFSAYYLPIVVGIAALTLVLRRDPLATAAVLVVACSCSIALATPIAMLASVGAAAKQGILIKGGRYLETLARADVLLVDKTGTLTLGKPQLTDIISLNGSAKMNCSRSPHQQSDIPSTRSQRRSAPPRHERGLNLFEPLAFESSPGFGVRAQVNGQAVLVGNRRMMNMTGLSVADQLEAQGKTLLFVSVASKVAGILATADTLRPEIPRPLARVRKMGIKEIKLLTGDNERVAASLAEQLKIEYHSNLLPENKISIVKEYQERGHRVVMVGDGVNDAPALAQADVGIAMGAAGTDIAMEAAHIALMRDDWMLVPQTLDIARRTMGIVKGNLIFTAIYNLLGLSLAALGLLPPIFAAAAQSLPDLGILGNSSRLLRQNSLVVRGLDEET